MTPEADPFFAPEDVEQAPEPDPLWTPEEARTRNPPPVEVIHVRRCRFKKKPGNKRGCAVCEENKGWVGHSGYLPTFNAGGSGGNRFIYQNLKKTWTELFRELLEAARLPRPLGYVLVEGVITFPDRGRRDQGNFRHLLEKIVGDTLTVGGWLEDDDWERYEFGNLQKAYVKGEASTRLMLFPEWPRPEKPEPAGISRPPGQEALI